MHLKDSVIIQRDPIKKDAYFSKSIDNNFELGSMQKHANFKVGCVIGPTP